MKRISVVASFLCAFCALSAIATPVTVQEVAVAPYEIVSISVTGFYSGGVYAGVNQLLVDSVLTDGFCIDPFHFSIGGPQPYNSVPLTSAPKDDHLIPGSLMTGSEAVLISRLWALAYSPNMTAPQAAGLQIAIWEVVGGADFHLTTANDYGASILLANAASFTGAGANLIALTGPGQDYVIGGPSVPDAGATATLFGLALAILAIAVWIDNLFSGHVAALRAE
jgi:hypothetical protein